MFILTRMHSFSLEISISPPPSRCMCVFVHAHVCIHIHVHVCACVCYVWIRVHMCLCMCTCWCVSVYIFMCICMLGSWRLMGRCLVSSVTSCLTLFRAGHPTEPEAYQFVKVRWSANPRDASQFWGAGDPHLSPSFLQALYRQMAPTV